MNLRRNVVLAFLLLLFLSLIACAGALRNYGRILPSDTVQRDMEEGIFHPEYRYYTSGSDLYPNAMIGLHRDYRLHQDTLWKGVAMDSAKLREIVYYMKAKAHEFGQFPQGFDLIDTQGKKIGFWYSVVQARTFVRFEGDGSVMIVTPDLGTFDKWEYKENPD